MGKKKAITNEALERRCWKNLAIAIILQSLDDCTALDDDQFQSNAVVKLFRQKDAFLFLNSSWFELLNLTKYTGNELIRMARRFKNMRNRHRFIESLSQDINGGTNNDQN